MKFSEQLNEYISQLSCTAREVCSLSGISAASFSRYKNGERVPELGTQAFEGLCRALGEIAAQRGAPDITAESVREAFTTCEDFVAADKEQLRRNFNTLVTALDVDEQFGLVVRHEDGRVETIRTGEVSVRGLYGYVE